MVLKVLLNILVHSGKHGSSRHEGASTSTLMKRSGTNSGVVASVVVMTTTGPRGATSRGQGEHGAEPLFFKKAADTPHVFELIMTTRKVHPVRFKSCLVCAPCAAEQSADQADMMVDGRTVQQFSSRCHRKVNTLRRT